MKDISETRAAIDAIDDQLVDLFVRRLGLMQDVAAAKRSSHAPVHDANREHDILAHVSDRAGATYAQDVRLLFAAMFGISRERQFRILSETKA